MAMPDGGSTDVPSRPARRLPSVTRPDVRPTGGVDGVDGTVSACAWWLVFCAGEIVSQASLTEMMPTTDWYGLGHRRRLGHPQAWWDTADRTPDGNALAGCLPESGVAFAVLANRSTDVVDTRTVGSSLLQVSVPPRTPGVNRRYIRGVPARSARSSSNRRSLGRMLADLRAADRLDDLAEPISTVALTCARAEVAAAVAAAVTLPTYRGRRRVLRRAAPTKTFVRFALR